MDRNSLHFSAILFFALVLSGCGGPDKAERKLPSQGETCNGTAIQNRYLVFYNNGKWEVVEDDDRENFKNSFVVPRVDDIKFIEYDQAVLTRDTNAEIETFAVFDNWGARDVHADYAWREGIRGDGITVAVIDSGADIYHPALAGRIAQNPGEHGVDSLGRDKRTNNVDDDKNGYVDDHSGYDFLNRTGQMVDEDGHGTHVSGIIAAEHPYNVIRTDVLQGVAPAAKILPLKFLGMDGGTLSHAIKAMDYAVLAGANVVNASWGGRGCSRSLMEKMSQLGDANVLLTVAAGNSGANLERYPEYPAAFRLPLQITVGAVGSMGLMTDRSNYSASLVHLFAPGQQVKSAYPGGGYISLSGTSMAAPFVAGAAALLMSARPDLDVAAIKSLLLSGISRAPMGTPDYVNVSQGRLNIEAALNAIMP